MMSGLDDDLFDLRAVWYVRHADGSTEDIVLEHGNYIEDDRGSCGQVIFSRIANQQLTEPQGRDGAR